MAASGNGVRRRAFCAALALVSVAGVCLPLSGAQSFTLRGTEWELVAAEYGMDARLLYAVALVETQRSFGKGMVAPAPLAIRTNQGDRQPSSVDEAQQLLRRHDVADFDVGLMQINVRSHRHRVSKLDDLLDPLTNLRVGAAILHEAMSSTKDPELQIGRYNTWSSPNRARAYAQRVMLVYKRLVALEAFATVSQF